MKEFIIMPEGGKWSKREAANHESTYCLECSWYNPSTKIAILETDTGITKIYSREIESNGNLKKSIEHDIKALEGLR